MSETIEPLYYSPKARRIGTINTVGLATLFIKETTRFLKVATQTIVAPVVTTLLFYTVFALAIGSIVERAGDVPFLEFLGPGLVMMGILQNSFANTSSSIVIAKMQSNIVDVLMAPLRPLELVVAYIGGGLTRGLIVGACAMTAILIVVPQGLHNPFFIAYHAIGAATLLAGLGLITGIWADKFDHVAAVTNFVITPAAFLSGTFYTIDRLPSFAQDFAVVNPVFYMIDGLRYGFIGHH